ncbi:MAG: tryptophan-rich sensory protein [Deltaproteobacteria bacterium]|nr:tryptophan-rich sensory protein [Deltaproteobacteria bacterium]
MNEWYETLQRPRLTPPDWVFGPVWTILYIMIGISIFLFLKRYKSENGYGIYVLIGLHLISNIAWTGIFFGLKSPGLALIDIMFLVISLLLIVRVFWNTYRVSSILLWPYLTWVLFATYLNASFYVINKI